MKTVIYFVYGGWGKSGNMNRKGEWDPEDAALCNSTTCTFTDSFCLSSWGTSVQKTVKYFSSLFHILFVSAIGEPERWVNFRVCVAWWVCWEEGKQRGKRREGKNNCYVKADIFIFLYALSWNWEVSGLFSPYSEKKDIRWFLVISLDLGSKEDWEEMCTIEIEWNQNIHR